MKDSILASALYADDQVKQKVAIKVHYYRYENDYHEWGLHLWGESVASPTSWDKPRYFDKQDEYGVFAEVEVFDTIHPISFLLHSGEQKDVISPRKIEVSGDVKEVWLKEGDPAVYTYNPGHDNQFFFVWIDSYHQLRGFLAKKEKVDIHDLQISDSTGRVFPIKSVSAEDKKLLIELEHGVDLNKNVQVRFHKQTLYAYPSKVVLDSHFNYNGNDLGANLQHDTVRFKLWSPPAQQVRVLLFDKNDSSKLIATKDMHRLTHGVWEFELKASDLGLGHDALDGMFYQYEVSAYGKTTRALDPYARSMDTFDPNKDEVGKAVIIDSHKSIPAGFNSDSFQNKKVMANPLDYVGYEAHVRDFTIDPNSNVPGNLRGTYLGFIQKIDHLKKLGITHVQFLPLQNFYTVNEEERSYQDAQVKKINYNWGYDPHNYFTPEAWYSTNPKNPYSRIVELKELIKSLHDQGIGAVLDVVYNHVYRPEIFENVAPGCYFRMNDLGIISTHSGAGPSLDSQVQMVRKLIVDSLVYFKNEFHFDGFRFDLMGFLDHETMAQIRSHLGEDTILYGEAWDFTDLDPKVATTKNRMPPELHLSAFNDTSRDAYTGFMASTGIVQGNLDALSRARSGVIASVRDFHQNGIDITTEAYHRFAASPEQTLNYLTIHDGFTLWDKLNLSVNADTNQRKKLAKQSMALLLTSQGKSVIHAGCEMGRSKPLAPNDPHPERAHTSDFTHPENGIYYFHENSYSSSDVTNMINWKRKDSFNDLFDYTRGLIELRRRMPGLRYYHLSSLQHGLRFVQQSRSEGFIRIDNSILSTLSTLEIQFIHGPKKERYYLVGEIFPKDLVAHESKNPEQNPFVVDFDESGRGSISFTAEQIRQFDLNAWGESHSLQVKLVKTPGSWQTLESSYSEHGNNAIALHNLHGGVAYIDLSVPDHLSGERRSKGQVEHYLAYEVDNTIEKDLAFSFDRSTLAYKKLLVIHNIDRRRISLLLPEFGAHAKWNVLADGVRAGVSPLSDSEVQISGPYVSVPPNTSAILGCLGRDCD